MIMSYTILSLANIYTIMNYDTIIRLLVWLSVIWYVLLLWTTLYIVDMYTYKLNSEQLRKTHYDSLINITYIPHTYSYYSNNSEINIPHNNFTMPVVITHFSKFNATKKEI